MIPAWAALVLFLAVDSLPLVVLVPAIVRRARAADVPPGPHCGMAFFGALLAGLGMQGLTTMWLVSQMSSPQAVSYRLGMAMMVGNGLLGSALAAGGVYVHLRMRTARDPDYEDAPTPGPPTNPEGP